MLRRSSLAMNVATRCHSKTSRCALCWRCRPARLPGARPLGYVWSTAAWPARVRRDPGQVQTTG